VPLNTVQAVQTEGVLKTENNLSEIRAYTNQLMAVGDIKLYAGTTAPKGWLACDGATVSSTTFPALFTAIGYLYGGAAGSFLLPTISAPVANTLYIIKATEYTP
jgi:hypothetical protein